jgi:hypothetical protein
MNCRFCLKPLSDAIEFFEKVAKILCVKYEIGFLCRSTSKLVKF